MNEEIKWPMITKDTPMSELKRIHQMIWDYAIEHGVKPKTPYIYDCVACEWVKNNRLSCFGCPIMWSKNIIGMRVCNDESGLYYRWVDAEGEERTALAKQIRDLPWKYILEDTVL